jgi:hypothetical protein
MEVRCELEVPIAFISGIKLQAKEKGLVPAFLARRVQVKVCVCPQGLFPRLMYRFAFDIGCLHEKLQGDLKEHEARFMESTFISDSSRCDFMKLI